METGALKERGKRCNNCCIIISEQKGGTILHDSYYTEKLSISCACYELASYEVVSEEPVEQFDEIRLAALRSAVKTLQKEIKANSTRKG